MADPTQPDYDAGTVYLVDGATLNKMSKGSKVKGLQGQITATDQSDGSVTLGFASEVLMYGIFQGELAAGYVPFRAEPNAPGLS